MKLNKKELQNIKFKFRRAEAADQDDIFELVKNVLSEFGLTTDPNNTDKDILNLNSYYFKNSGWFEVVEDKNLKIIGSYGIYKISETECELRKMYLYKNFQGLGLGKEMMLRAFHKAKELGFEYMILETNKILKKAVALYKKYGFTEYHPNHLSERCNLTMRRSL